jgi:toxin ParE1/3/4
MQVFFTQQALNDLESIYEYYCEHKEDKAKEIVNDIVKRTEQLSELPYSGTIDSFLELWGLKHRFLVEGNYKIMYKVTTNAVFVTQIFDTRQNPEKLRK